MTMPSEASWLRTTTPAACNYGISNSNITLLPLIEILTIV